MRSIFAGVAGVGRPFYGWAVVAVATVAAFCSGPGQSYVFSVFVDPILADTGLSRVQLSTLYAFGTAVSAAMVVVVARLADRFGARLMLAVVALALGLACFGMSFAAGPFALFFGFAALRALGQGSLPLTATMLASQWFVKHRGRAIAIVVLGIAASNALLPPFTQALIGSLGWREAYIGLGLMVWVLLVPAAVLVVRNRPEDLGLHPDGSAVPVEEPGVVGAGGGRGFWRVVSSPDFWALAVPLAAVPFVVTALVFHQISILSDGGLTPEAAAGVFVAFAAASAGATALSGALAERIGPRGILMVSLVLLFAAVVDLQFVSALPTAVAYSVLLGAAAGTQGVAAGMIWAHYYGRAGLGRVQGPATMVMISAAALAPLPLAAFRQLSGDYALGLLVMAAIPVQVVPLGGLGEIGKNMTAVRQESGIVLVDAGMAFPDEETPGIDLILPDFSYLREHKDELKGIVLTHGHEDHVGALPYVLREFNVPVYGTKLTLGLVRSKLKEFGIKRGDLREIKAGDKQKLGGFGLEFVHVNHSIPDAVSVALRTNAGLIVFSGDYKIDLTPIEGEPMDLGRLAALGDEGVLAFFGDSTNSERPGYVPSEKTVEATFEDVFAKAGGRIIVASFASHIHRVSQVVEAAKRHDRLVAVTGRSMVRNVEIARELGYLDLPSSMLVDQKDIGKIPDSDLAILMTGSQGEPMAALSRIAAGTHRTVEVGPRDTVVVAAHPIPGNERGVARTINGLMQRGAEVRYSPLDAVHVSGHGAQEEQKIVLSLLKPKFLVPVHGEFRMLKHHKDTAMSLSIPEENIFILENGGRMEFEDGEARRIENVDAGMFLVDAGAIADTSDAIMRERQQLSGDGMFVVVARVDARNGRLLGPPDVISRGFADPQAQNGLVDESIAAVTKTLERTSKKRVTDAEELKKEIRKDLSAFLSKKTRKRPIVLPLVVEV